MTLLPTSSTPASEGLIWRVNSLEETLKYILENRGEGGGIRLEQKTILIQRFFTVYWKLRKLYNLSCLKKWKGWGGATE